MLHFTGVLSTVSTVVTRTTTVARATRHVPAEFRAHGSLTTACPLARHITLACSHAAPRSFTPSLSQGISVNVVVRITLSSGSPLIRSYCRSQSCRCAHPYGTHERSPSARVRPDFPHGNTLTPGTTELYVYHMMMGESDDSADPDPCSTCSFFIDQLEAASPHLTPRISVAVIAKAGWPQLAQAKKSKGWTLPVGAPQPATAHIPHLGLPDHFGLRASIYWLTYVTSCFLFPPGVGA